MSELPQGAVEAAARAIGEAYDDDHGGWTVEARAALSAAAPYLAAQTLRDAADALDLPGSTATGYYSSNDEAGYREAERDTELWLRARADRIEAS
jgi:hypothetical protein